MAAGINIAFASDVRSFLKGTGDIEKAMDDVGGSLDDVARDAERKGREIGDDLERVGREGEDAAKKLERTFRDSFDDVRRDAKRATDDVADDTRRAVTGRGGEAVSEFKQEARQNFSEVASSFSGGIDGAADLVQGTLGGLAGSLAGPAGLAAGLLAGIGGALFASMNENAEKSEQRVRDMYADMLESGLDFLSDQAVAEGIAKIFEDADDATVGLDKAREYAETLGISVETVAAAFAGSGRAQSQFNAALAATRTEAEALREAVNVADGSLGENFADYERWQHTVDTIADAERRMTGLNEDLTEARTNAQSAREATEQWTDTFAEQEAAAARAADQADEISQRYRNLASQTYHGPRIRLDVDLADAERTLRTWRPVVTGTFRAGQAVV